MKTSVLISTILIGLLLTSCTGTNNISSDNYLTSSQTITYQQFYDDLSPYGRWVDYPGYGYVWRPEEAGFRPYASNGHWAYSTYGWTWVSDYNWGWAPFHYGRWFNDNGRGWLWVPGYDWAPAWVSWRSNAECYGWAPLGPDGGFNGSMGYEIPADHWNFIPHQYINSSRLNNYYIDQRRNTTIINNTTIIKQNPTVQDIKSTAANRQHVYSSGPDAREVERETKQKIIPVAVREIANPQRAQLDEHTLKIYKPQVTTAQHTQSHPVLPQSDSWKDKEVRESSNGNNNMQPREFQQPSKRLINQYPTNTDIQTSTFQKHPRIERQSDEKRYDQEPPKRDNTTPVRVITPEQERMPAVTRNIDRPERSEAPVRNIPNTRQQQEINPNTMPPQVQAELRHEREFKNIDKAQPNVLIQQNQAIPKAAEARK